MRCLGVLVTVKWIPGDVWIGKQFCVCDYREILIRLPGRKRSFHARNPVDCGDIGFATAEPLDNRNAEMLQPMFVPMYLFTRQQNRLF